MGEPLLDVEATELRKVPGVKREMLLDSLPRFVHANAPVTVKECVEAIAMPSRDAPSERAEVSAMAMATAPVHRGLDWLVDQGYLDSEKSDNGHILYSATSKLDDRIALEG